MKVKFTSVNKCVNCEAKLTSHQEYYSNGVCPYCGRVSSGTICDTKKVVVPIKQKMNFFEQCIAAIFGGL